MRRVRLLLYVFCAVALAVLVSYSILPNILPQKNVFPIPASKVVTNGLESSHGWNSGKGMRCLSQYDDPCLCPNCGHVTTLYEYEKPCKVCGAHVPAWTGKTDDRIVTCRGCGWSHGDMGPNVSCPHCGYKFVDTKQKAAP